MAKRVVGRLRHIPEGMTRQAFSLRANLEKIRREMTRLGITNPLRAGQQRIHNREGFNYGPRNMADVGIHPNNEKGMKLRDFLENNRIPYQAFTGAIPGASSGPHVHIGFPSLKTTKKFPVGTML